MFLDKTKGFLLVIFPIILLDQISKGIVSYYFKSYLCNSGIAFGLFPDFFSLIFYAAVLVLLSILSFKQKTSAGRMGLFLVIGGGLSNLIDRIFRHCVLDFLDLGFWPSFNFADSMIFVGIVLVLVSSYLKYTKH